MVIILTENDGPKATTQQSELQGYWPFGHGEKHFKGFHTYKEADGLYSFG